MTARAWWLVFGALVLASVVAGSALGCREYDRRKVAQAECAVRCSPFSGVVTQLSGDVATCECGASR